MTLSEWSDAKDQLAFEADYRKAEPRRSSLGCYGRSSQRFVWSQRRRSARPEDPARVRLRVDVCD